MNSQKMRRTILLDLPRNVTSREYAVYSLQWALIFVALAGAAGSLLASLRGDAHRAVDALEQVPAMTVADAGRSADAVPLVRIEAQLGASTTEVLPDDPEVTVVLGSIELIAKTTEAADGSSEAVLHRWEHVPDTLWLVDGDARLELEVDLEQIPRTGARAPRGPERMTDGAGARLSRTVGYRYLDQEWPLPEEWGKVRSASARVERRYVPSGSPFVVVGRLAPGEGGAVLIVDGASGGSVNAGTLEEIRVASEKLGQRLRFAWLPLLMIALWLLRRVLQRRREFVRRSNES